MWQIIPTIGTVLALAAFFFALYFRAISKYTRIAIEGVRSVGALPAKSRLDATKIIVNVFDLDVNNLSTEQQFELAKKTFEKRESDSKRNFYLLLLASFVLLIFVSIYSIFNVDGGSMVRTALLVDKASAEKALEDNGYFHRTDEGLVASLAAAASMPNIDDPFERANEFNKIVQSIPSVRDLRQRAYSNLAPFEIAGDIMNVSVPSRSDQPRRFRVWVKRNSPYANQILTISAKGRNEKLRLLADPGIENSSEVDLQVNHEQFLYLIGSKPDAPQKVIVQRSSSQYVVDPSCPVYRNFPKSHCELEEKQDYRDLSSLGSRL